MHYSCVWRAVLLILSRKMAGEVTNFLDSTDLVKEQLLAKCKGITLESRRNQRNWRSKKDLRRLSHGILYAFQ